MWELDRQVTAAERGGTWARVGPVIQELASTAPGAGDAARDRLNAALGQLASIDEILAELTARRRVNRQSRHPTPHAEALGGPTRRAPARRRKERRG